jgi:hypothetical protein
MTDITEKIENIRIRKRERSQRAGKVMGTGKGQESIDLCWRNNNNSMSETQQIIEMHGKAMQNTKGIIAKYKA